VFIQSPYNLRIALRLTAGERETAGLFRQRSSDYRYEYDHTMVQRHPTSQHLEAARFARTTLVGRQVAWVYLADVCPDRTTTATGNLRIIRALDFCPENGALWLRLSLEN
jgi:hypothetical protein